MTSANRTKLQWAIWGNNDRHPTKSGRIRDKNTQQGDGKLCLVRCEIRLHSALGINVYVEDAIRPSSQHDRLEAIPLLFPGTIEI